MESLLLEDILKLSKKNLTLGEAGIYLSIYLRAVRGVILFPWLTFTLLSISNKFYTAEAAKHIKEDRLLLLWSKRGSISPITLVLILNLSKEATPYFRKVKHLS